MKKHLVIFMALLGMGLYAEAQVNPHAIGLRIGGNGDINGAEISYQHGLSESNRLELDLGFGGNSTHSRFGLVGIYHWDWNIDGGFNWYLGPGAGLGYYNKDGSDGYVNVAIGGQIGIEYDFNANSAPILLSLDVRPMWDFIGDNAGFGWGIALGIRYTW